MGSITHNKDLEIIKKSIKTLRKKYNKAIQFYLVGGEKTDRSSDWYTKIEIPNECKNYPQFVHWLRQQQQKQKWDIAVAPLADTLLNRCKSYLKYLDYSALYLPGIYSRIQPYESVIKDGVNGLLVDNNCQSWCTAIETLYKNPTLRKTIQDNAYQDIIENHRCDLIVQTYLKTLYGALSQN
jgi:glycosyltransferase involved in cell wall biosynthesis